MVYNSMYPIGQRPYAIRDNRKPVKKREDEESSQSSYASQNKQDENQITQHTKKNKRDDLQPNYPAQIKQQNFQTHPYPRYSVGQQQLIDSKKANETAQLSYNENLKNSTVNIAQILKDFRNTAAAIGTPEDLTTEVNSYLSLVEAQVQKDDPNVKLIKSNLKNASTVLDGYITETLQKPSNVVENWMDALFLQKINFKFNEGEINPQFLVKFPDGKPLSEIEEPKTDKIAEENNEQKTTEEKKPAVYVPSDSELKSLFLQAKKFACTEEPKKAMQYFQKALARAEEVKDSETESKIFFEIGKIYDKSDYLAQALTSYDKSLKTTSDNNIKVKAHFSMAQIYDDVAQFDPAMDHYISSIAYAGESDNFKAQSSSLTKIGNMYTEKYDREAFDFYSVAQSMAQESKDSKTKGYVSSSTGDAYAKFDEPKNALKYYSGAIKEYSDSPQKAAVNYQKAAEVMQQYGNTPKAKSLLQKALLSAKQAENAKLIAEIEAKLKTI